MTHPDFDGAKLVLLIDGRLVTILRDDRPDLAFSGLWDLPGGGRDGNESPEACVLRETREELGLSLPVEALVWRRCYPGPRPKWAFAARLSGDAEQSLRLGDEGQRFALVDPWDWISRDDVIPHLRGRVRDALAGIGPA